MASTRNNGRLKRTTLAAALGLCFIGGVHAQTNTAGAVAGRAAAGDTITVSNPATGFTRTITVGADGAFRFSQIPIGQYTVTRNGSSPRTGDGQRRYRCERRLRRDACGDGPAGTRRGRSPRHRRDQPDRRHLGGIDHDPHRRTDRQDSRCRATRPPSRCSRPAPSAAMPSSATSHRSAVRRWRRTRTSSTASTSPTRSATSTSRRCRSRRSRNSRSRPAVTAPNSAVRWAA